MRAGAHDRRIALWLVASFSLFYLFFARGHFHGSDELGVFEVTQSLYERCDLDVPFGYHVFVSQRDGRYYNHFAIGQSVLALPFYALGSLAERALPESWSQALAGPRVGRPPFVYGGSVRHFAVGLYAPLAGALLVAVFFGFQRRLGVSPRSACASAMLLGTVTYAAPMSVYFLRHSTEAITLLGGLWGFCAYARGGRLAALWAGSALASATLLVRVPALAAAPALAGYLIWALRRRARVEGGSTVLVRALPAILLPLAAVALVHMAVDYWKWGSWLDSPMLAQSGRLRLPLHVGLAGLLLSPGSSLFLYTPLLLMLPWTLARFWTGHRAECLAIVALSLSFLLVAGRFIFWHGLWSAPGPRYLFVLTPFLLLPLGAWLDAAPGRRARGLALVLAVAGALVQLVLLGAGFDRVMLLMDYPLDDPDMSFLLAPSQSPILGSARAILAGGLDTWLWELAEGRPDAPARPVVAAMLLAAWGAALVASVAALVRGLRAAEAAPVSTSP